MATTASFKQQCPSCEAMVPIRDANLIGRKIDCPKCKYRFVVEDPGEVAEAEEEADAPKTSKKGARGEEENGRRLKGKAGPRKRDEDDEGEDAVGAGKGGGNQKLILIVSLSAVAVVVLVVVGYFLFSGDSPAPSRTGAGGSSASPAPAAQAQPEEKVADNTPQPGQASGEFITNLLPPTTEGICSVHLQDLQKTALGRAIFDSPGAFDAKSLEKRLGFLVDNVDLLVMAWNFRENWALNVLHTTKPMQPDAIKASLHAKPVAEKDRIEGQEYYILDRNAWLDRLGHSTFALLLQQTNSAMVPKRSGPVAMQIYDAQTLVFADLKPMQEFLKVKGRFANQTAEPPKDEAKEETQPAGGGNKMQGMQAMMGGGMRGGMPMQGGGQMQGGGPMGRPGQPEAAAEPAAPAVSGSYLTVRPELKAMLDRVEAKKPLVSLAVDAKAASQGRLTPFANTLNLRVLFQDANVIGAALLMKEGITLTLAAAFQGDDDARRHQRVLAGQEGKDLAEKLTKILNTKVELPEAESDQQNAQPGVGPGGFNAAAGAGGMRGMQQAMQAGMMAQMMQMSGAGRGGPGGAGGPGGRFPGMPGFGGPQAGSQQQLPKEDKPNSTLKVVIQEKTVVVLTVNLIDQTANSQLINGLVRQEVMKQKGYLDMTGGSSRIHELAAALRSYPEGHQAAFPRGTRNRAIPTPRAGRPYPPDQRVSFFAELLPYLGAEQASLYSRIEFDQSWRDPDNLSVAATLVPQFLDPEKPPNTWWVRYPGNKEDSAATHYVGIGGIGLDAAEYSDSDPAVTPKRGVFAYDQATRLSDITDKKSETILLAQVPPTFKRPWMAGGGSTIMGVPEKDSIKPFLSTQRDGKRGTNVVMVDGSVRFLSENISDEVFKALCTAKGGEPVLLTNRDAPLLPPPEAQADLKDVAPHPVPPPPVKQPRVDPPAKEEKPQARQEVNHEKVVAVFQNNCAMCHTGARAKGKMQLFTSPGVFNRAAPRDKITDALAEGKMPPKGRPRVPQSDLATLQSWLSATN